MSAYSALASFYDTFTGNVDYERRADFVVQKLALRLAGDTDFPDEAKWFDFR